MLPILERWGLRVMVEDYGQLLRTTRLVQQIDGKHLRLAAELQVICFTFLK